MLHDALHVPRLRQRIVERSVRNADVDRLDVRREALECAIAAVTLV